MSTTNTTSGKAASRCAAAALLLTAAFACGCRTADTAYGVWDGLNSGSAMSTNPDLDGRTDARPGHETWKF